MVGGAWEEGISENGAQTNTSHLLRVMGMFTFLTVVMVTYMYTYIKTYQVVHFKCVQFIVGQLYLSKDI